MALWVADATSCLKKENLSYFVSSGRLFFPEFLVCLKMSDMKPKCLLLPVILHLSLKTRVCCLVISCRIFSLFYLLSEFSGFYTIYSVRSSII
jgi:hypothetical protein